MQRFVENTNMNTHVAQVCESGAERDAQKQPTRRMAIANGTCVSFCNQPKAHFGLPWVRPWDNRGKCYMDGKRIQ